MILEQSVYFGIALLLILLNAFFVLAEFAIVKVRVTRMHELADKGNRNAGIAVEIIKRLDAYLSTCQLGITVASMGLGWVGDHALGNLLKKLGMWSPAVSVAIAFTVFTLLHVVIGELVPKSIAIRKTERAALFASRPLRFFHFLTFPAMWVLTASSAFSASRPSPTWRWPTRRRS
jgi:CBS domain containing-hemolysin-like protein